MIYYCADDYGLSPEINRRLEALLKGRLNKFSFLPNGFLPDLASLQGTKLTLHLNLVEGKCLSDPKKIPLLAREDGCFRHAFVGLLLKSLFQRKQLKQELETEISAQLAFWKTRMGDAPLSVDSHQHTHMIPLVLCTLLQSAKRLGMVPGDVRFPAEPVLPYLTTPALYGSYQPANIIKHWLLNVLGLFNRKAMKESGVTPALFMGVMFSGHMTEQVIAKLLPKYEKLAQKRGRDIEIACHPGFTEEGEALMEGIRPDFCRFYASPWRKKEFEAMNINIRKEG